MKNEKVEVLHAKEMLTDGINYKRQRWILIAVVVPAVVESVTLLAVSWSWRYQRQSLMQPREQHLCWEPFIPKNDGNEKNKHCQSYLDDEAEEKTNMTRCCGTMHQFIDGLATKNLLERYDSDINPELSSLDLTGFNCISKKTQPFVRVVDIANDKKPVKVGNLWKLFWKHEPPSSTRSTSGLRYLTDDGTIYVEETELYFVSLQFKTKVMKPSARNGVDDAIRYSVYRISNGTEAVILEDVQTMCETTTHEAEITSELGAVFRLAYGDRLFVATSHPQNVAPDPHNNYFSVYRI